MSLTSRTKQLLFVVSAITTTAALTIGFSSPMQAQQDPPLKQLMRGRHRLLRRAYVNSPDCDVKGLAASIKAEEITSKHRIRAVRYLSTVDSVEYPEAKQMLIDTMHSDRWEVVRFEAARALRVMMSGGADSRENTPRMFRRWVRLWRRHTRRPWRRRIMGRRDYWVQVCDPETLGALVRTAYEQDCNGVCFEPSLRVRQMAVAAIIASGVECDVGPYRVGTQQALSSRPVLKNNELEWSKSGPNTELPPDEFEAFAPFAEGSDEFIELGKFESSADSSSSVQLAAGQIDVEWQPARPEPIERAEDSPATDADDFAFAEDIPSADFDPTDFGPLTEDERQLFEQPREEKVEVVDVPLDRTIPALNGFCIVELRRSKNRVSASPQHRTQYAGRLYEFSTAQSKKLFDASPDRYAVAYGGFDPVRFAHSGQMVEGQVLCEHGGRLYAFATRENRKQFLLNPSPYSLQSVADVPTFDLQTQEPESEPEPKTEITTAEPEKEPEAQFASDALVLIAPPPSGVPKTTEDDEERATTEADFADMDFGATEDALAAAKRMLEPTPKEDVSAWEMFGGTPKPNAGSEDPPWEDEPESDFADTADWYEGLERLDPFAPTEPEQSVAEPIQPQEIHAEPEALFEVEPAVPDTNTKASMRLAEEPPWNGNWRDKSENEFFSEPSAIQEPASTPLPRIDSGWERTEPRQSAPQRTKEGWQSLDPRTGRTTRRSHFDSALRLPDRGMSVTPITAAARRTPSSITRARVGGWSKPVKPVARSRSASLLGQRSRVASVRSEPGRSKTTPLKPQPGRQISTLTRSGKRTRSEDGIRRVSTSERSSGSIDVFSITGRKKESAVRHAGGASR